MAVILAAAGADPQDDRGLSATGAASVWLIAYEIRACPTRMRSIAAQSHEMPTPIAEEGMA